MYACLSSQKMLLLVLEVHKVPVVAPGIQLPPDVEAGAGYFQFVAPETSLHTDEEASKQHNVKMRYDESRLRTCIKIDACRLTITHYHKNYTYTTSKSDDIETE